MFHVNLRSTLFSDLIGTKSTDKYIKAAHIKRLRINQSTFCHVSLETKSGKFWMFAVLSVTLAKCSIMCGVQCTEFNV